MERSNPRSANTSVRKRALVACELCRSKKTKCDNSRPSCESCARLRVKCLYKASNLDQSPFDVTNQAVLERLDYLVQLVETQNERNSLAAPVPSLYSPGQAATAQTPNSNVSLDLPYTSPYAGDSCRSSAKTSLEDTTILSESVDLAGQTFGMCEALLQWPIFENKYPVPGPELLIFQSEITDKLEEKPCLSRSPNGNATQLLGSRRLIHEEDALRLAHKFLSHVHIKNPILEEHDLFNIAKEVMEHGFGWDERSCLMLIVCALGSLCSEFTEDFIKPCQLAGPTPINSVSDAVDYASAETYYIACRKRVGLLGNTIVATECQFYSGVYEMFSLRPLRAWSSFNNASKTLQMYLKAQPRQTADAACSLVRSLYWSCLKSEWEFRMEIDLPPSGLATLNYGEIFPLPPASSVQPHGEQDRAAIEKSWNFYLSELAVRRIGNRLMGCFYQHDETWWLSVPLERLIRIATEIELQLTQWVNHLPQVGHAAGDFADRARSDELTFYLHGRLLGFTERVYRPFLYLALYHPMDSPIQESLRPYVQKHIETCLKHTLRGIRRHRHHGTWYQIRECVSMCFLLLAAVKSGKVRVSDSWREAVETTIAGCMFWEMEATDVRALRCILMDILEQLSGEKSVPIS